MTGLSSRLADINALSKSFFSVYLAHNNEVAIQTCMTLLRDQNTIEMLLRFLELTADDDAEKRFELVLGIMKFLLSSDLIPENTLARLAKVLMTVGVCETAFKMLPVMRYVAPRACLPLPIPVKVEALASLLVFTELLLEHILLAKYKSHNDCHSAIAACDICFDIAVDLATIDPRLPYPALAGFVPLMRRGLERTAEGVQLYRSLHAAALKALTRVFIAYGSDCAADVREFARSDEFAFLAGEMSHIGDLQLLRCCVFAFPDDDDDGLRSVFTTERCDTVIASMKYVSNQTQTDARLVLMADIITRLGKAVPHFTQRVAQGGLLEVVLPWRNGYLHD